MIDAVITGLLWFSAIGCGLIAGLYFAFSTFIMTALQRVGPAQGAAAMNAINAAILRSLFMPLFLGTSVTGLVLAGLALVRWGQPGAVVMLVGGLVYVVGMFLCTMVFNVPLNNALADVDPASARGAEMWSRYLIEWTFWNHVRTIASTAACAFFIMGIAVN
jgi:uncharacterized membrane protein